MEDAEADYNVWIIKNGDSEENLNWQKSGNAFQRFKELFDQNIQNQTDPICIGMTANIPVLDMPVNPGLREFLYMNLSAVLSSPGIPQQIPGYEYIDPILFVSAQVWLWKEVPDHKIYWIPVSVKEFEQEYLLREIQIDT